MPFSSIPESGSGSGTDNENCAMFIQVLVAGIAVVVTSFFLNLTFRLCFNKERLDSTGMLLSKYSEPSSKWYLPVTSDVPSLWFTYTFNRASNISPDEAGKLVKPNAVSIVLSLKLVKSSISLSAVLKLPRVISPVELL